MVRRVGVVGNCEGGKLILFFNLFAERYHSLDSKAKANPLSLEEMILMTIYS